MNRHIIPVGAAIVIALAAADPAAQSGLAKVSQVPLGKRSVPVLWADGLEFKDLNRNGRLDRYEDWRAPLDDRVNDLVRRMTLEEKAGLMVSPTLPMGPDGTVSEEPRPMRNPFGEGAWTLPGTSDAILGKHIRQFINRENAPPKTMAAWLNGVQEIAERSRLGIPAFFVTNPRNHLGSGRAIGIDEAGGSFSQWPGTLGLAATRDADLVEESARIAAREYVSVGIRGAYHPQADLATEPRWGRIAGTLGEDADLTSTMIRAMVRGFQGDALGPSSVALIVKHFPGGGPADDGHDSHFALRQVRRVSRRATLTTTCAPSRPQSTRGPRRSCPTTRFRRASPTNRSATPSTGRSSRTSSGGNWASKASSIRTPASRRRWCGASRT